MNSMAWADRLFRKGDVWIVVAGVATMRMPAALLIDRFLPVEGDGHTDFIDVLGRSRYEDMLLRFVQAGSFDRDSGRCR